MNRLALPVCIAFALGAGVALLVTLRLPAPPGTRAVHLEPAVYRPGDSRRDPPSTLIPFSRVELAATADLSRVTFTFHLTPADKTVSVGMQIFAHRQQGQDSSWEQIVPRTSGGGMSIFKLTRGLDNAGAFDITLPKGTYGTYRLLLFEAPDGVNVDFGKTVYDSDKDSRQKGKSLKLEVKSGATRVTGPVLQVNDEPQSRQDGDTYEVTFSGQIEVPNGYQPEQNGLWVMAKGDGGFAQGWFQMSAGKPAGGADNPHTDVPWSVTVKGVKPGLHNSQFGVFKYSWGDPVQWVWPGVDYEAGGDSWVQKADPSLIPPRLKVVDRRFELLDGAPYHFYEPGQPPARAVAFVRGGNYGNALDWTIRPELNSPDYFQKLRAMGCRFMRVLFDPDKYLKLAVYRDAVDQVVQNIWAARLYPVIAPQDLASGDSLADRLDRSTKVVELLALRYKGKSIWLEVCNEPHEIGSWQEWKPDAVRMVQTIRRIDPNAFVIVPFEGWSKDGRGAAKEPISETHVDLYDGHAYVPPDQVAALFGPAVKSGLPVYIGEYGSTDPSYLDKMDLALQNLPGLMAVGPWAFTKQGQDSLPLVQNGTADPIQFTPAGRQIAEDYALWDGGKKKAE